MRCPKCASLDDRVLESRALADGRTIRRRRECLSCAFRFTSYERIEEKPLMVIKRDGERREPFDRTKLEKGITQAVRKRPVSQATIETVLDELEETISLEAMDSHEIDSVRLGELVLSFLDEIDPVAYVRFASVYRNYETPEQFVLEIERLSKKSARPATAGGPKR